MVFHRLRRSARELAGTFIGGLLSCLRRCDSSFVLDSGNLLWLRRYLDAVVTRWDLALTYAFDHPLIRSRTLVSQEIDEAEGRAFRWKLRFFNDPAKQRPLSLDPFARSLVFDWDLYGSEEAGVVAMNDLMVLRSYRTADGSLRPAWGNGIGPTTYARELKLYKRWRAQEIHLNATEHGRTKWIKLGFVPQDLGWVKERYDEWALANGVIAPFPENPKEYPEPFLMSLPWLPLYKVVR